MNLKKKLNWAWYTTLLKMHYIIIEFYLINPLSLDSERILVNCDHIFVEQESLWSRTEVPEVGGHDEWSRHYRPHSHLNTLLFITQSKITQDQLKRKIIIIIDFNVFLLWKRFFILNRLSSRLQTHLFYYYSYVETIATFAAYIDRTTVTLLLYCACRKRYKAV